MWERWGVRRLSELETMGTCIRSASRGNRGAWEGRVRQAGRETKGKVLEAKRDLEWIAGSNANRKLGGCSPDLIPRMMLKKSRRVSAAENR